MLVVPPGSGPSYLLPQGQTSVDASSTFLAANTFTSGGTLVGPITFRNNNLVNFSSSTGVVSTLSGTIYIGVQDGVGAIPLSSELPAQYIFFANANTSIGQGTLADLYDTQEHANYYSFTVEITAINSGIATATLLSVNNGSNFRTQASTITVTGASSSGSTVTCASTTGLVVGQYVSKISGTGVLAGFSTIASIINLTTFVLSSAPLTTLSGATLVAVTPGDYNFLGVYLGQSVSSAGVLSNTQKAYPQEVKHLSYGFKKLDSSNIFAYNSQIVPLKQALFYTPNYVVVNGYPVETDGIEDTTVNGNVVSTSGLAAQVRVGALATGNVYTTLTEKYNTSSTYRKANNIWAAGYYDDNATVWDIGTAYAVNDLVVYSQWPFRCIATRSAGGSTPILDSSHWEPGWYSDDTGITPASKNSYLTIGGLASNTWPAFNSTGTKYIPVFMYSPGGTTYAYKGYWNSATAYVKNDYVTYLSNTWVCIVDNNNNGPSVSPAYWNLVLGKTSIKKSLISDIKQVSSFSLQDSQYFFTNYCPWAQSNNAFTILLTGFLYNNNPSNSSVNSVLGSTDWYSVFSTGKQTSGILSEYSKNNPVVCVRYYGDGSLALNVGEAEVARLGVKNILQRPYAPVIIGLNIKKSVVSGKTLYTGTLYAYDGTLKYVSANIVGKDVGGYTLSNTSNDCFIVGANPTIDPENSSVKNYFEATMDILEIDHYYGMGSTPTEEWTILVEEIRKLALIYGVNQ